ncbi:VRR-NUC domain-containing protein [Burkholderia gladioli]|uniref:VRR-NUC domain-containing protein n=1 Tax=Burkholderia gladioli TaxID=28095 RepID=UPI0016421743|nr:VRR-NUC domain-containing protein [Burkholderia gladioli]
MLEKTVETYLVERVRALGGTAYKFTSPARASVPDRIVILPPGRIYFIEVKRPGGKLTRGQEREREHLRRLGADVRVLDSIGAINAFLNEVETAPAAPGHVRFSMESTARWLEGGCDPLAAAKEIRACLAKIDAAPAAPRAAAPALAGWKLVRAKPTEADIEMLGEKPPFDQDFYVVDIWDAIIEQASQPAPENPAATDSDAAPAAPVAGPASQGVIAAALAVIECDRAQVLTDDHIDALDNAIKIQRGEVELPPAAQTVAADGEPTDAPVAWMRVTDITEWTDTEPETDGWTPLYRERAAVSPATADERAARLDDADIDVIAESMPGGIGSFMKQWGWRQFARAVEDEVIINAARAQGAQGGKGGEA